MSMGRKRTATRPEIHTGPDIDCTTCIHRDECARFAENTFCTKWQGREPADRGPDPNGRWRAGEPEAPFES